MASVSTYIGVPADALKGSSPGGCFLGWLALAGSNCGQSAHPQVEVLSFRMVLLCL